jgi:four helix bundle protein
MDLFVAVTRLARKLPVADRLVFESQIRRAALSVALNISEGHQRRYLGDYIRSVCYARGEHAEVETAIIAIGRTVPSVRQEARDCMALAEEVGRLLTALYASLRRARRRKK